MKTLTELLKKISLPLIVIYIAFLSYNFNFFHVVNDDRFLNQKGEWYVLDGILKGKDEYGKLSLGRYIRTDINNQISISHKLYNDKNKSGKFIKYDSQYGLQLHFFHYLKTFGYDSINIFQGIISLFMSCVVGILFHILRKDFSIMFASIFSATLIFSPWVVVFARNLYWVEATWFLPMIISMYYGKTNIVSKLSNIKFFVFLTLAFLIKMLCGYEYLTTVFIASCVPIILYMSLEKYYVKLSLIKLSVNTISVFVAFFIALVIHSQSLSKGNSTVLENINNIYLNARIKLGKHSLSDIRKNCETRYVKRNLRFKSIEECVERTTRNDAKSITRIVSRYFIIHDFLPWIGNYNKLDALNDPNVLGNKDYNILKAVFRNPNIEKIKAVIFETGIETKKIVIFLLLNTLLFFTLILFAFLRSNLKMRLVLMFSFAAPLSWFIIAKSHSSFHYQFNYVLWYLPFIPFSFAALFLNSSEKKV